MLIDRFKKLISNAFDNKNLGTGELSFTESRLTAYLSNSEKKLATDIGNTKYLEYKKLVPIAVSSYSTVTYNSILLLVSNTLNFSVGDLVIVEDTENNDFYDVAMVGEIVDNTSITVFTNPLSYPDSEDATLQIKTRLQDDLDDAIVFLCVAQNLHKLISIDQDMPISLGNPTGIGQSSRVVSDFIFDLERSYFNDYTETVNKYQEEPSGLVFGLI